MTLSSAVQPPAVVVQVGHPHHRNGRPTVERVSLLLAVRRTARDVAAVVDADLDDVGPDRGDRAVHSVTDAQEGAAQPHGGRDAQRTASV